MQKEQLIAKFQELYGEGGEIRTYFAPGRVNLIGEHTDYNGVFKLNYSHSSRLFQYTKI